MRLRLLRELNMARFSSDITKLVNAGPNKPHISSRGFSLLTRSRIGMKLDDFESRCCRGCAKVMDAFDDHALCCPNLGVYARRNALRNEFGALCIDLDLPVLPDQGPNTDTTRPADLLITGLSNRPIAVDFSITHALQPSLRLADVPPGKAALKIEKTVRDRTPGCRQMGWDFVPFVVEAIEAIRTSTGCNSYYHL